MKSSPCEAIDVRVQRQQPMLSVDRPEDAFAFRHFQNPNPRIVGRRLEGELLVAGDDDGAGDRRQVARLPALLVVLHELVDLAPDDLPLIRLLVGRDPPLEKIPVDLRDRRTGRGFLLAAAHRRLGAFGVTEHFEADELVDIAGSQ